MTDDELERMRAYRRALSASVRRLAFAEMVLDRLNAEVDGIPWREAARLSESLGGEPVTEPVAPKMPELAEQVGWWCNRQHRLYMMRDTGSSAHEGQPCCTPVYTQYRVAPANDPGVQS